MKPTSLVVIVATMALLFSPAINFAQAAGLGTAANFVLFTMSGDLNNTGSSLFTGNIGTNNGSITGFGPPAVVAGNIHIANGITEQCSKDILEAYSQLDNTTATSTTHAAQFGNGETLYPGVYAIPAAGSLAGSLSLDAQGDPDAVFIFKIGRDFSTAPSSSINLLNGAKACNVFWKVEGMVSIQAATLMKGTLIAHNGIITMATGSQLEGRLFSTMGAITADAVSIIIPACAILPIELLTFTAACDKKDVMIKWSTASETNSNYFTVERSAEGIHWQPAGTVRGAGNSSTPRAYVLKDSIAGKANYYYRLKQTDLNGHHKYSNIVYAKKCAVDVAEQLTIYPNPSDGKFSVFYSGDKGLVLSTEILNASGEKIDGSTGFKPGFDLSGKAPGIYFVRIQLDTKIISGKIVVKK